MTIGRVFPVLGNDATRLRNVPWSLVEPHRETAMANHRQSLEQLASRGGLSLVELAMVIEDRPWRTIEAPYNAEYGEAIVRRHLAEHVAAHGEVAAGGKDA